MKRFPQTRTDRSARRQTLIRLNGLASLALLPAGSWAASGDADLVVRHAQGETRLAATPRRVAVFDLAALDCLQAIGVDVAAVPKAAFPVHLQAFGADRYAKVGTLFEPDEAALHSLKPDLIIVGGRSASKYSAMSAIAPTIDLSTSTDTFLASVTANLQTLGRLFDRQAQAATKAEELSAAASALQARAGKAGKGLLLFAAGQGLSAQAAKTRFGVVYELIGITPAVVAADLPAPRERGAAQQPSPAAGSPEAAAAEAESRRAAAQRDEQLTALLGRVQPDWLFILDRNAATGGEATAAGLLARQTGVQKTPAWARQRVVYLDAPGWYLVGGGYGVLRNTIDQVGAALDRSA